MTTGISQHLFRELTIVFFSPNQNKNPRSIDRGFQFYKEKFKYVLQSFLRNFLWAGRLLIYQLPVHL